jgi:DNA adenine methylase
MKTYTEFSLYLPFFELIDELEEDEIEAGSLVELMRLLEIRIHAAELYSKYDSYGDGPERAGRGDVCVYFSRNDLDRFIMIDLFHDFTDQHNMVRLGVRCNSEHEYRVKEVLEALHTRVDLKCRLVVNNEDLLKLEISQDKYPKKIRYGSEIYMKDICYYHTPVL